MFKEELQVEKLNKLKTITNRKYLEYIDARRKVLGDIYFKITGKKIRNINNLTDKEVLKKFEPIEKKIIKEIESRKKDYQGKYFNGSLIENNDIIRKYFPIKMVNSIRGIGKTFWMEQEAKKEVEKGNQFVWMRLRKIDVIEYAKSEATGFFAENKWKYMMTNNMLIDEEKDPVGYYLSLNTLMNAKGNKFPNVYKVFFDEFSVIGTNILNKWNTLANFLTTIDRKDSDVSLWMCANYVSPYDEFVSAIGLEQKECGDMREREFVFNWLTGAILWNVQAGFFREKKSTWTSIGKRSSLVSYEAFSKQYQSSFNRNMKFNIANSDIFEKIVRNEIVVLDREQYYMISKLESSDFLGYFIEQEFLPEGTPIFGVSENDCVFDLRANILKDSQLKKIRKLILQQKMWFTNKKDYQYFVDLTDVEISNEIEITEIKESD